MNSAISEKASVDELRRGLLKALFGEAAKETSRESNRRKIYQLWREEGGDE
jgi:ribosomal RNA-processing protein 1